MELVLYRQAKQSDLPYIFNSMLKAMRSDFLTIRTSAFYDLYKPQVQDLVGKSQILIACYKNDHDLIYGYVVYEKLDDILILHWVNVKLPFRRMGLAKLMLKELGKDTEDPAFSTYEFKLTEITQRHFIKFKPELRRALAATR